MQICIRVSTSEFPRLLSTRPAQDLQESLWNPSLIAPGSRGLSQGSLRSHLCKLRLIYNSQVFSTPTVEYGHAARFQKTTLSHLPTTTCTTVVIPVCFTHVCMFVFILTQIFNIYMLRPLKGLRGKGGSYTLAKPFTQIKIIPKLVKVGKRVFFLLNPPES